MKILFVILTVLLSATVLADSTAKAPRFSLHDHLSARAAFLQMPAPPEEPPAICECITDKKSGVKVCGCSNDYEQSCTSGSQCNGPGR